ncbi:MAG: twin-arginine translocase TatA/TatE family subunit [Acidobacteriaceae bacterium]
MEILGIGPLELFFILLIALIVLGPGDMVKAGRTLGRFLRKIITSSEWRTIQKASRELRYLPNRLMRDASLEDLSKDLTDINKISSQISTDVKKMEKDLSSWTTPPENISPPSGSPEPPAENVAKTPDTTEQPESPQDQV